MDKGQLLVELVQSIFQWFLHFFNCLQRGGYVITRLN